MPAAKLLVRRMRIPVPERFRLKPTVIFITVLVLAQQIEKTSLSFSLLTGLYILLFTFAFNAGGGLYYLAGAFVFFNGVLSAIAGIVYKVFLGEPGQSNLLAPDRTMAAYCLGMACMGVAAALSRRFMARSGLLAGMAAGPAMKQAAIGCLAVGIFLQVGGGNAFNTTASLSSAINQLNHFIQMAIILGTTYEINHSNGKSSSNWIVWTAGLWLFFFGLIVFSKEGIFVSVVSWLIPAVVLRFEFSRKQLLLGAVAVFVLLHYLVPFSQYGRSFRPEGGGSNAAVAFALLRHPEETRSRYFEEEETQEDRGQNHYYDKPQGLFDREQMLSVDDALIDYSDQGNLRGFEPTYEAFENIVPRFFWKDKPAIETGNEYGREIGVIGPDDNTTGISFSLISDAYHQDTWFGVGFLVTFVTFLLFLVCDSVAGDTRKSPWGLLLIAIASHIAPEGLIGGAVYLLSYGVFSVIIIALLARYALPLVSSLLTGSGRTQIVPTRDFKPMVRGSRINPILRQPDSETPPA